MHALKEKKTKKLELAQCSKKKSNIYIVTWTIGARFTAAKRHFITKTRLFKYIENFYNPKKEYFQIKKILIFFIFLFKT